MANILSTSRSRRYPRLGFVIAADRICTRGQEMRFWDTLENVTCISLVINSCISATSVNGLT